MKNGKDHLFPVGLLDKTFPDLVLLMLLGILICNMDVGWYDYSCNVERMFLYYWQPVLFLWWFFWLLFTAGTIVCIMVILYMSVMRHLFREKLRKRLFFCMIGNFIKDRVRICRRSREARLQAWSGTGRGCKAFPEKAGCVSLRAESCISAGCSMDVGSLAGYRCGWPHSVFHGDGLFFLDLRFLLKISSEVGVLLDKIEDIAEDRPIPEESLLKPYSLLGEWKRFFSISGK